MGFSAGKNLENNINTTEAQTLSNKTLDNSNLIDGSPIENSTITGASIESPERIQLKQYDDLASAQADISNRNGGELIYVNDIKKTFQVNDDGLGTKTLAEISGGSAGINYILNPDAEVNADGWSDYANTTPGELPDDFGGTVSESWFNIVASAEIPLRGSKSFVFGGLNDTSGNLQGHGVYYSFTVDSADLAKKLTISFDYLLFNYSLMDAVDGMLKVFIYDEDKSQLIRVNGEDIKLNDNSSTHYAQFQTDATSTNYRLVIHNAVALGLGNSLVMKFDNVKVGPREVVKGAVMTDAIDYTPTINSNTNVSVNEASYTRIGDSIKIQGRVAYSGAGAGTSFYVKLPSDLKVDTDKLKIGGSASVGHGVWLDAGTRWNQISVILDPSSEFFYIVEEDGSGFITSANFANGDFVSYQITVPIQGWSSNAVTSEDLGGREVVVIGSSNSGQSVSNAIDVPFTEVLDTTSSWDGSSFTAPESGDYSISGCVNFSTTTNTTIEAYIDGSLVKCVGFGGVAKAEHIFNGIIRLEKGEVLSVRPSNALTLAASTRFHWIHIQKLASPQTILETETVAARYTSNSGQAIANNAGTDIVFEDLDKDTHNAYNTSTGEYTVPASGWYQVNGLVSFLNNLNTANVSYMSLSIIVDGTSIYADYHVNNMTPNISEVFKVSELLELEKGQVVKLQVFQNNGAIRNLAADGRFNTFSIARIK
jgi:hypothetical protein